MVRPNYKDFRNSQFVVGSNQKLEHSAKGSTWEDHKYVKKIDGVYYYPVGYEDGRTIESLSDNKQDEETVKTELEMVKNHFDQYLAARGIDWRTLPKDEVDQMQRDIAKQLESGKSSGTSEKSKTELAEDVINGKFGTGEERKKLLGENYAEVQKQVNEMMKGSTGSKKVSEASDESVKKAEEAAKNASKSSTDTKVHSGVDMEEVQNVYRKKN